jgi:hypothetical protein
MEIESPDLLIAGDGTGVDVGDIESEGTWVRDWAGMNTASSNQGRKIPRNNERRSARHPRALEAAHVALDSFD